MGRNCIELLLDRDPHRLAEVYLAAASDGEDRGRRGGRRDELSDRLHAAGVPVHAVGRRELTAALGSDSHQGVVARVSQRPMLLAEELLELVQGRERVCILALDGVLDPHNLGAILRAAECFGVDGVVWSKNRAAPLGAVVSKVSVGASEVVPLCAVSNLHRTLEQLKAAGLWSVGATVAATAAPLHSFTFPERCVVVVGSEGEGIQDLIQRSLDFKVFIPMMGAIDSLNVSQATAVFLAELGRQAALQRGVTEEK
jgi:23S rRNA (guanosine2251-2'-O)-methyltransferase